MNSAPDKIRNSLFVPRSRVLLNFIENLEPFSEVDVVVLILALGAKNETVVNNRVKVFQDLFLVDESERIGVLRLSLWKESESSLKHFKVCLFCFFDRYLYLSKQNIQPTISILAQSRCLLLEFIF